MAGEIAKRNSLLIRPIVSAHRLAGRSRFRRSGTIARRSPSVRQRQAFTLIELLVVIAVIALLLAILMTALQRARELGKRVSCLSNLKQLQLAWVMYADDFDGKIVNGIAQTGPLPWLRQPPPDDKFAKGALYAYCPSFKILKCPAGVRGEWATYQIVYTMNGHHGQRPFSGSPSESPPKGCYIRELSEIRQPNKRIVFIDEGRLSMGSWSVYYDEERWWDCVPARHGMGTNFSFADVHAEYRKWTDPRTIEIAQKALESWTRDGYHEEHPDNEDLRWVQKGVWGKLGY